MPSKATRSEDYIEEEDVQEEEEEEQSFPRPRQERRPAGRPFQRPSGRRFRPRRKVCSFCVDKVKDISYKETDGLRRFLDGHGKIIPRRKTGTCAKHQRRLALAVKRARHLALLPFSARRTPYS
jgi:small subunit ribosomal protein S18